MTALELNAEFYKTMGIIANDESLMSKALTKEEFLAKLERGEEEYRQGKCVRLQPGESLSEMLRRSGL
jgi:hypothetical protein